MKKIRFDFASLNRNGDLLSFVFWLFASSGRLNGRRLCDSSELLFNLCSKFADSGGAASAVLPAVSCVFGHVVSALVGGGVCRTK